MLRSTRAALAVGLGCVGVAGLVGQSVAQQGDAKVNRVANAGATAGTAPAAPSVQMPAVVIGSIDIEGVFKAYDKVKVASETLQAEGLVRYNELNKLAGEGKQEQEKLQVMKPGTPDAKKCEDRMVQIKAQIEAGKENARREFTQKECEMMASIYNEVSDMAKAIARDRQMTFVVKYNEGKLQATDQEAVIMSGMSKTIIYADPRVDITNDTIKFLNYRYKQLGGRAPKTPGAGATGAGAGAAPAASPAPAGGR